MTAFDYLQAHPGLLIVLASILGLLVGSFLNVVIHRLPVMMEREWTAQCRELMAGEGGDAAQDLKPHLAEETFNLAVPRSRCPKCGHAISALENIPLLSYLWLRGRCAGCGVRISPRYPLVELTSGLLCAVLAWLWGATPALGLLMLFTWTLIVLTLIDYDHQLLPDSLTLPLLWLGLIANAFGLITDLQSALWGAVFGYLTLWSVYWLFKLATGKEGMGYGDFKLLAALGAWMGWQSLPLIVILSSLVGALIGATALALQGRDRSHPIPFGPFLAIAGWIALVWGDQLIALYWQWIGGY
ncbi:A24 family peptidase [Motiliproteus sp. SC1-56]|uniref:prepilin peptidase n=1 Tax=Motiliproteus sp. SC1-56 TaxID=2799565 RepID=UPI001A8E007D|nr:A24 family peptidase [Motiliproteus sp. SC1-56]